MLPIIQSDGRAVCPQQRRQERYRKMSQLTNTKIHRHGVACRIHASLSIGYSCGKQPSSLRLNITSSGLIKGREGSHPESVHLGLRH